MTSYPRVISRGPAKGTLVRSRRHQAEVSARARGFKSYAAQLRAPRPIRSPLELSKLPSKTRDQRNQVLEVIAQARREGRRVSVVAKERGVPIYQVQRWAPTAIEKKGGRWQVKPRDTLMREVQFLTPQGQITVQLYGRNASVRATQVSRYWHAVEVWRDTGDASLLREFRGKFLRVGNKQSLPFITDIRVLRVLRDGGELSLESLYQFAA
jgi:hypothetical protein